MARLLIFLLATTVTGVLSQGVNNVAYLKTADQSSTAPSGAASQALNNVIFGTPDACAMIGRGYEPWWRVDLGAGFRVHKIVIFNRPPSNPESILGAIIRFGDSWGDFKSNPIVGQVPSTVETTYTINIEPPMFGRYVTVQKEGVTAIMNLCELRAYGFSVECPSGAERFGDSCYVLVPDLLPQSQARARCQQSGGDLASSTNKGKNDFIADLSFPHRAWIGGYKAASSESFSWYDGSPWDFTNWRRNEPNAQRVDRERCLETNLVRAGKWNDHKCSVPRMSVCELSVQINDF